MRTVGNRWWHLPNRSPGTGSQPIRSQRHWDHPSNFIEGKQMNPSTPLSPPQPAGQSTQPDASARPGTPDPAITVDTGRRRKVIIAAALVLLIVVALIVWKVFFSTPALPASIVAVSGRVEGDDSAVASKTTGRLLEVRVREGDTVNAGDPIAILDDAQIRAREDQARAALAQAEAKGRAALAQIAVLQQQLLQNRLQVGQSKLDTQGHVKRSEADLAAAQSDLAQQQAAYVLAAFDKAAYPRLAKSGAVSERQDCRLRPPPISRPPWWLR